MSGLRERCAVSGQGCLLWAALALAPACGAPVHEEHLELASTADSLTVEVGSGDVKVVGADVATVKVVATLQGDSNHLGSRIEGKHVTLFGECKDSPCAVDISATVPSPLLLELHTGSGDISAKDITGAEVSAQTGSGDVKLRTKMPVERLSVKTGSGDVHVDVPHGTYKLDLDTGSGNEHVDGVAHDPAAVATIELHTGSGDVTLLGR